jgi:flagellar assembly protein FliH
MTARTDLLDEALPRHHALLLRRAPQAPAVFPSASPTRPAPAAPERHIFASFDLDPRPAAPEPPKPDPLPSLLAAERAAGFAEGEAVGRAAAASEREELALTTLRIAVAQLADAAPAARAVAEEAASAVAELMLSMLAAALPSLASRFAEQEAAAFAARILPALTEEPRVEIRVSPDLAEPLAARFASISGTEVSADPTLPDGDVTLHWHGGHAERRAAKAQAAVAALLSATGFATARVRQH